MTPTLRNMAMAMGRSVLPAEVCGLVAGPRLPQWDQEAPIVVSGIVRVRNAARSPTRFALDGKGMMNAEARIVDGGDEVIGVIHSHPVSAAVPSATDLADALVYDPDAVWLQLIVSLQGFAPNLRAWRFPPSPPVSGADPTELAIDLIDGDLRSP